MKSIYFYKKQAAAIRRTILLTAARAKSPHIGSALSTVDILTVLYFFALKLSARPRDKFILSKGHGVLALYTTLAQRGLLPRRVLDAYGTDDTKLAGHPILNQSIFIEATTGSLGHGLSMAMGMALAAKRDGKKCRIFVMLSDGECDEGSVWEAVLAAAHFKLDNLTVIIDYNKIQSFGTVKEVVDLEPLADKWKAFNWSVKEVDGHDVADLAKAFSKLPFKKNHPSVLIAHTVKGKGVSFAEHKLEWHYKNLNDELLAQALKEQESA